MYRGFSRHGSPLWLKFSSLLVILCSTNWFACIPYCHTLEISDGLQTASLTSTAREASGRENSLAQDFKDFIGVLSALREQFWEAIFSPTVLAKAMPNMVSFLPNLVGGVLTNILELVIDYGLRLLKWMEPSTETIEMTGRYLSESVLGNLFQWDVLGSGLRLMRVRRSCRPKAACECGAYVLNQNYRVARFLNAMRSHLANVSFHWPAMMNGLRGEPCEKIYSSCQENFIGAQHPLSV